MLCTGESSEKKGQKSVMSLDMRLLQVLKNTCVALSVRIAVDESV